jgi:hypothetical protein
MRSPSNQRRVPSAQDLLFCALSVAGLLGCGEEAGAPPSINAELRQSIKQNLTRLGAKVTAEVPEGLYVSLRNTHVEVLELGGVVESVPRTRQDVVDFGQVNVALAKGFLDGGELPAFQQWLRHALSPRGPNVNHAEYSRYELNMSRAPLRVVFSPRASAVE